MWLQSGGTVNVEEIVAALSIWETPVRKWKYQDKLAAGLKSNVTRESIDNVTKRGAPKKTVHHPPEQKAATTSCSDLRC